MSAIDDLLRMNEDYASAFDGAGLPGPPRRKLAIVACMDARLDVYGALGLQAGDAHVIRNAGGVITDDEIRSLAISQRELGTEEVMLLHHTRCGMTTFEDEDFLTRLEAETGERPRWAPRAFADVDENVRASIRMLRESPFLPRRDAIRGFVFDVDTGGLREVFTAE